MSENVLDRLSGLVGYIGEGSESDDIRKIIVIETAHVTGHGTAVYYIAHSVHSILGYTRAFSEVISRTGRDITDRYAVFAVHYTLKALAESTISSGAHNEVKAVGAGIFSLDSCIVAALSRVDCHLISGLYEFVNDLSKFF